jgi:hypothetical protein
MNKLLIILFFAAATLSCKKDYPRDIPQWVKVKIKEMKRESGGTCSQDVCRQIIEYSNGANTLYFIQPGGTPIGYRIYDHEGNIQCYYETVMPDSCGSIHNLHSYQLTRLIWQETY